MKLGGIWRSLKKAAGVVGDVVDAVRAIGAMLKKKEGR
jgi:hypothetical protein